MSRARAGFSDRVGLSVIASPTFRESMQYGGKFAMEVYRADPSILRRGLKLLSRDVFSNLVVNAGLTYVTGSALLSVTVITAWKIGLIKGGSAPTIAAADTIASHAGWTEAVIGTDYDEAARQAWTGVAGSAGAATNSASLAVFTIAGTITVRGAFICSASTGTSGTLLCAAAAATARDVVDNTLYAFSTIGPLSTMVCSRGKANGAFWYGTLSNSSVCTRSCKLCHERNVSPYHRSST